ncbi:hypothetical protein BGP75_24055 [Motiliproteus sp. MSK22-1]|nr:hypothetical protein BGP75_24055 [Motiliproteus sp. MSK22-1]
MASSTSSGSSVTSVKEVGSADAAFFSAALNEPRKDPGVGAADRIIGQLTGGSGKLQELERVAMRDLKIAAKANSSGDLINAARSVSSFYLESMLAAKVVGKGVQAIEKLTNLQ